MRAFDVGLFFFSLRYVAPPFPFQVVIGQLGSVARLRNEDPRSPAHEISSFLLDSVAIARETALYRQTRLQKRG